MIEVRTALSTYLKSLHSKIYFQVAPENATFPYIVYDIPNSFSDGEGGEVITLDIDGWDMNNTGDTTVIETLMQTINSLDKKVLTTDNISVVFYLENKMALIDDDKRIKRRKYTYSGRLIRR
ncbi:hypothetical protein [Clostridium omnivorum]|uniref:DUF3168 domain-containing protein n=1 Tax=Clostridium omnivorum TaxID=1604902 RepID=A0ABQ5ND69_9CLOT|nr:hypothetical protein [Clostridium sp. E14]GLC32919.1 hypothetical protein bsdE14_43290 [Clostridium sp. E14]